MAPVTTRDEDLNPFPGLRPFSTGESEYFFGRETECREITERTAKNRFLAVLGVSGSGKTSLLQCGLIPGIKSISLNGPPAWVICNMKPGNDPFSALAGTFTENLFSGDQKENARIELTRLLRKGADGIDEALKAAASKFPRKTLLIIDQFEELFRYGSPGRSKGPGDETAAFINLLIHAVTKGNQDFHLVIAIRSDLLSECARYRGLTALLNDSNYFISGMQKESIRSAIEGPLKRTGVRIDSELVDLLVSEINDRTNQLPVLQHTLMRLWARWKEMNETARPVGFSDFNAVGTVKDSISRDADEIYGSLNEEGKDICERMFKAITGKGSDNKGIRYPSDIRYLKSVIRCGEKDLVSIIEKFRDPSISLLTPYSGSLDDGSIIDLSHESLILLWNRLKRWVDEEASSVQMYLELSESSALYQQGRKGLLISPDLELAVKWRDANKPTLWWAQKYNPAWERAMVYLRTSEKKSREEEERKARLNRWRLRRIRTFASVFGGVAILTAIGMSAAFVSKFYSDNRRKEAEDQKNIIAAQKTAAEQYATAALKKYMEADSNAVAAVNREAYERSLKENAETRFLTAVKIADNAQRITDSVKRSNLLTIEQKNEVQRMRMISVAKSMSLRSLQTKGQKDLQSLLAYQAYLFNRKNNGFYNDADIYMGLYNLAKEYGNEKFRTYSGHEGKVLSMAFVPGKNEFYTSGSDGNVIRWDPEDGTQGYKVVYSGSDIIDVLTVSPRADWLACGTESSTIRMIPIAGNESGYELKGHSEKINSLIFSSDGNYLYSASLDGKVLKWDLMARTSVDLASGIMKISSIDISSGGKYIAGVGSQGNALIWDPGKPADAFRLESAERSIRSIRFKPDEDKVAVGYNDGKVEIWDIGTRKKVSEFFAHSGEVNDIRFNLKLPQMATSGSDEKLKLWDLQDTSNPPVSFEDNGGMVIAFGFSPDGQMIASATVEGKPRILQRPTLADYFVADGCAYVTRNFTPEEWTAYVGKDITYEKTCPGADLKIKIREIR